jgi:cyanophycinase
LFRLYGFSTKHVSAHIDNYRRTTDLNNADGQYNLEIIRQADVLFFNGGDQSRHARTWLNNDGTRN